MRCCVQRCKRRRTLVWGSQAHLPALLPAAPRGNCGCSNIVFHEAIVCSVTPFNSNRLFVIVPPVAQSAASPLSDDRAISYHPNIILSIYMKLLHARFRPSPLLVQGGHMCHNT